jgi:hypothetical protein
MDDNAYATFTEAVKKLKIGPVETADLPAQAPTQAAKSLALAVARFKELAFDDAAQLLLPAIDEAVATGALGLSQEALCDLYLYLAMSRDRADWRDLPEGGAPAPSDEAWQAYLQSAALCPERQLYSRTFPPIALLRYTAAQAELKRRGQSVLFIASASDALISVDGRPVSASPLSLTLPNAEHFVRVERPGRLPWISKLAVGPSRVDLQVPDQVFKTFPDSEAAAHARRLGAAYALVAELKPGEPSQLELRLVQVVTGRRIDSTRVALGSEVGGVYAAVMRMDALARQQPSDLERGPHAPSQIPSAFKLTPPPAQQITPTTPHAEAPEGWAQKHWPVLVAVGAVVAATVVLGLAVALND